MERRRVEDWGRDGGREWRVRALKNKGMKEWKEEKRGVVSLFSLFEHQGGFPLENHP